MPTGLTRRNATPLLRTVGGKPHATDNHHEEVETRIESRPKWKPNNAKKEAEEDINAEPMSSDEELNVPAPRKVQPPVPKIPAPALQDDAELTQPQKKPSRKRPEIQRPAMGAFEKGRTRKVSKDVENKKENSKSIKSSVAGLNDNPWDFDSMDQQPLKKQKTQKNHYGTASKVSSYSNIHARPSGKSGGVSSGKNPVYKQRNRDRQKSSTESVEEDDLSEVSVVNIGVPTKELNVFSSEIEDKELHTKKVKTTASKLDEKSKSTTLDDKELTELLEERSKAPRLIHQLGDWVQGKASTNSQPASSAPEESLHNINEYIDRLPQVDDEETQCALCKETVDLEDYCEFWKDKEKTVKNHTAFCNMHKRKSAQSEYDREGFPQIDWDQLPKRIRKYRAELLEVFNNDRPSEHRDRYEPLALTGKAAAVPSRRKDLPSDIQEELESYALDDQSTYPGYYGPRGRRLITENVMKVLKNEVKNCTDPVVQGSGPAAFIQAVIVPESAILLIMEDCRVSREEAEAIREKTYEMGLLLNEEIEDQVEDQQSDDDEGNEYNDS